MKKRQTNNETDGRFSSVWTKADIDILTENWPNHTENEVKAMLPQFSLSSIRAKAHHLGMSKRDINRQVIAFEPDGVKTFQNVKEAATYYGLRTNRVYSLIYSGEETFNGVSFNYLVD